MYARLSLSALMAFALPLMSHPVNEGLGLDLTSPNPVNVKRQGPGTFYTGHDHNIPCYYNKLGEKKADLIHHWQVSKNLDCGNGECAVAEIEQHTFGIEASVGIAAGLFSAGVGLTSEWTNGNSYECSGQAGEVICVWAKAEYAVYDVAAARTPCLSENGAGETVEAKFPKADGQDMYCVRGPCREQDQHYWQTL